MTEFKAYGFNLREIDYDRIKGMGAIITDQVVNVYDIKSYDPEINASDVVLLFGIRATRTCQDAQCSIKLLFPDIIKLDPTLGELSERKKALATLSEFKACLDSGTVERLQETVKENKKTKEEVQKLTEDTLSHLKANKIEILESILRQQGSPIWTGKTLEGKTISLSVEPEKTSADINLTFAELYALGEMTDRLRVKELEIVYKPSSVNRKNNSK